MQHVKIGIRANSRVSITYYACVGVGGGIVGQRPHGPSPTFCRGKGQVGPSLCQPVKAGPSTFKRIKLHHYH